MEISQEEYVRAMNEFKVFGEYEYFEDSTHIGLVNTNKIGIEKDWDHSLKRSIRKWGDEKYKAFGEPVKWIKSNLRKSIAEHKRSIGPIKVYKLDEVTDKLNDEHANFSKIDKVYCQMTVSPKSQTGVKCLVSGRPVTGAAKNGPSTDVKDVESIEEALGKLNYEVKDGVEVVDDKLIEE